MTQTDSKPNGPGRALVWCPAEHLGPVATALEDAGWRIGALGVPPSAGASEPPAFFVEAVRFDDPRQLITDADAGVALFIDPSPLDDPAVVRLCARRELRTLTTGPAPATVRAWTDAKEHERWSARVVPLLADSVVAQHAGDAMEPVGALRSASIRATAPAHLGGVPARLFDAMHLLHRRLGLPERVDASCSASLPGSGLRTLAGELHAHLRYPAGNATLAITDTVSALARDAVFVCDHGVLRLTDEGFTLTDNAGVRVDAGEGTGEPAIVEQLRRAIDQRLPAPERYNRAEVLAMCEAAALSVRTGEPERPRELLEVMG